MWSAPFFLTPCQRSLYQRFCCIPFHLFILNPILNSFILCSARCQVAAFLISYQSPLFYLLSVALSFPYLPLPCHPATTPFNCFSLPLCQYLQFYPLSGALHAPWGTSHHSRVPHSTPFPDADFFKLQALFPFVAYTRLPHSLPASVLCIFHSSDGRTSLCPTICSSVLC